MDPIREATAADAMLDLASCSRAHPARLGRQSARLGRQAARSAATAGGQGGEEGQEQRAALRKAANARAGYSAIQRWGAPGRPLGTA